MSNTIRGFSLVAACAAMAVALWPGGAPFAGDFIVSNLRAETIALSAPADVKTAAFPAHADMFAAGEEADGMEAGIAAESRTGPDLTLLVEAARGAPGDVADDDFLCLVSAIYYEARGEPLEGQLAVAQVVLNRVEHRRWPSDICGVVYQPGQFSFTFDGRPDVPRVKGPAWRRAEAVAAIALGEAWHDVTEQATFFHATYVKPRWRHAMEQTRRIGGHIFYR